MTTASVARAAVVLAVLIAAVSSRFKHANVAVIVLTLAAKQGAKFNVRRDLNGLLTSAKELRALGNTQDALTLTATGAAATDIVWSAALVVNGFSGL